jgi:hypothetical protein
MALGERKTASHTRNILTTSLESDEMDDVTFWFEPCFALNSSRNGKHWKSFLERVWYCSTLIFLLRQVCKRANCESVQQNPSAYKSQDLRCRPDTRLGPPPVSTPNHSADHILNEPSSHNQAEISCIFDQGNALAPDLEFLQQLHNMFYNCIWHSVFTSIPECSVT